MRLHSRADSLFVASTYKAIMTGLSFILSHQVTQRLAYEATEIIYRELDSVDVEAADMFRGNFDDVVVTGWLKGNENVFSPPLKP